MDIKTYKYPVFSLITPVKVLSYQQECDICMKTDMNSFKALRSHGQNQEEGPRKTIETPLTHSSHAYFLLPCEEGFCPEGENCSGV